MTHSVHCRRGFHDKRRIVLVAVCCLLIEMKAMTIFPDILYASL
jgi:hypothetical protein